MAKYRVTRFLPFIYGAIGIAMVASYMNVKDILLRQDAWVEVMQSPMTLNVVLLLFVWGVFADKTTKKMPRWKGWLIWGIGYAALILVLATVGGVPTRFGA